MLLLLKPFYGRGLQPEVMAILGVLGILGIEKIGIPAYSPQGLRVAELSPFDRWSYSKKVLWSVVFS